jgi:hypothetical protein
MTWQIPVAVVASFLISSVYYGLLGRVRPDADPMTPVKILLELLRSAVVAAVMALACDRMGIDGPGAAIVAGLLAWVGFPGGAADRVDAARPRAVANCRPTCR